MSDDTDNASDRPAAAEEVKPGSTGDDRYDVSDGTDNSAVSQDVAPGEGMVDELEPLEGVSVKLDCCSTVGAVG